MPEHACLLVHVNPAAKGRIPCDGHTQVHQRHDRCCYAHTPRKPPAVSHCCDVAHPVYLAPISKSQVQGSHDGRLRPGAPTTRQDGSSHSNTRASVRSQGPSLYAPRARHGCMRCRHSCCCTHVGYPAVAGSAHLEAHTRCYELCGRGRRRGEVDSDQLADDNRHRCKHTHGPEDAHDCDVLHLMYLRQHSTAQHGMIRQGERMRNLLPGWFACTKLTTETHLNCASPSTVSQHSCCCCWLLLKLAHLAQREDESRHDPKSRCLTHIVHVKGLQAGRTCMHAGRAGRQGRQAGEQFDSAGPVQNSAHMPSCSQVTCRSCAANLSLPAASLKLSLLRHSTTHKTLAHPTGPLGS